MNVFVIGSSSWDTLIYVDDIPSPAGTLHLAFGLSTIAAGEITAIDLDPVRNAPGVVEVLTAEDLPFANDVSPSVHDEPLLATGTVHYIGQPIFIVVADSHLNARKAARLTDSVRVGSAVGLNKLALLAFLALHDDGVEVVGQEFDRLEQEIVAAVLARLC